MIRQRTNKKDQTADAHLWAAHQADKKVLPCPRGSIEGAVARGEAPSHHCCRAAPIEPRGDMGGTWPAAPHDLVGTCLSAQSADSIDKRNKLGLTPSATSRPSITTPSQFTTTPSRIRLHCPKQRRRSFLQDHLRRNDQRDQVCSVRHWPRNTGVHRRRRWAPLSAREPGHAHAPSQGTSLHNYARRPLEFRRLPRLH